MKLFTNTSLLTLLVAAFVSFNFTGTSVPNDHNGAEPWARIHNQDGIIIMYDIQDCLRDNLLLCLKIVNNTDQQKKLRFSVDVSNPDGTRETYHFIKTIAPYTTEKSDCSEEGRRSGLLRMLKNATEASTVTVSLE